MQKSTLSIIGNKVVLNIRERMCETSEELLASDKFRLVLDHCLNNLEAKNSPLLEFFGGCTADEDCVNDLVKTLSMLVKYEAKVVPHRSEEHTSELQSRQYLVCRLLLE